LHVNPRVVATATATANTIFFLKYGKFNSIR